MKKKILIGIVLLLAAVVGIWYAKNSLQHSTGKYRQQVAEEAAKKHLAKLYPGIQVNIACSAVDSNNDGYISCDYTTEGGTSIYSLDCSWSYVGSTQEGCRARLPLYPTNTQPQKTR